MQNDGAVVGVVDMLVDFGRKLELFDIYQKTPTTAHRKKQTPIEVHIWLLEIVMSIYNCFRAGFYGKSIMGTLRVTNS